MRTTFVLASLALLAACGSDGGVSETADESATRLVGIGHAALEVPESWFDDEGPCGVPTEDVVIFAYGAQTTEGCPVTPSAAGVESVTIGNTPWAFGDVGPFRFVKDSQFEIDGVTAERTSTVCVAPEKLFFDTSGADICWTTVWIPSLKAAFTISSSTDAETVEDLVGRIFVDEDRFGIPHDALYFNRHQERSGARYVRDLEGGGVVTKVVTKRDSAAKGFVLGVSPEPGTVVDRGDSVTVTIAGEPLPVKE